ncbi:MAG TPA: MASE4 domain-containing protein [Polyangiaceae bacterium]|nr:MASE4 domain-containing protein [Polyangiaceae bacterium]
MDEKGLPRSSAPPAEPDGDEPVFLGRAAATTADRRRALAAGALLVAAFAATAPWADRPLRPIPPFVPAYNAAVIVLDALTALLLYAQYRHVGERSFLALACGYLLTPWLAAAHALSFPDAFGPGYLLGGPQTASWLWVSWHNLFPLSVAAYALLAWPERRGHAGPEGPPGPCMGAFALAGTLALAAALIAMAVLVEAPLPELTVNNVYQPTPTRVLLAAGGLGYLAALWVLLRATHLRRRIDLWIAVTLVAHLIDLALTGLLASGRYQFGFYLGRLYGLLGAGFVLAVLIRETVELLGGAVRVARTLREGREAQAFLLALSDRLRPLSDPAAIMTAAAQMLCRHFGIARAQYCFVGPDEDSYEFAAAYSDGRLPATPPGTRGRLSSRGAGWATALRAGQEVYTGGDATDQFGLFAANVPRDASTHTGAMIPLVKGGHLVAFLLVAHSQARRWTAAERALRREVANRTWAAVESARFEAALREARDRLEEKVAARTFELAAEMSRRADLTRRLAKAQEAERLRVARDLHDSVGQLLAGLSLAIKGVSTTGPLPPAAAEKLADVQRVADLLGREVHGLAVRLRPTSLDDIGLEAALGQLVREWSTSAGVPVDFQTIGLGSERLPAEVETVLYRVVQEALTNVAKHARATQVSVVVSRREGVAMAVIEDDGVGFETEPTGTGRLGLIGMRERVGLVGGDLDVESGPGQGTTIFARVPIADGRSDPAKHVQ